MMIIKKPIQYAAIIDRQGDYGVFDTMNDAIQLACEASKDYSQYSLSIRNDIVHSVINVLETHIEELTSMYCKEAGTNSYDDILYYTTVTLNNYKNDKLFEAKLTPNNSEDSFTTYGVVVPSSNPVETIIKNSILSLKLGNAVVFSSNKNVKNVFAYIVKLINNTIQAANGPKNLVVTVKEPSIENTDIMIEHEKVTMLSNVDSHATDKIAL